MRYTLYIFQNIENAKYSEWTCVLFILKMNCVFYSKQEYCFAHSLIPSAIVELRKAKRLSELF